MKFQKPKSFVMKVGATRIMANSGNKNLSKKRFFFKLIRD